MPHRPYWYRRIDEILRWAEAISDPVLDRKAIEAMFGVSQTEAQRTMKRIGSFRLAGALMVPRFRLVEWLKRLKNDEKVYYEQQRVQRLEDDLEAARRMLAGRKVVIQRDPDVKYLDDMPAGIQLRPGELRIEFFGTEDLLRHLFELSQIIMNDYVRFQSLIEE